MGYDVIDVNLACPVKKIKKKSRGGHLMSVPDEAVAILDAVKQAVGDQAPCTVKLRRGSNDSAEALDNFHTIFQAVIDLGYVGAVVHGRSVEQKYLGPSNWNFLRSLTDQYGGVENFTIGGSGDIWQPADIFRMINETGVQWVSVARGCIGNPWVFRQARALLVGDQEAAETPPTIFEQRDVLLAHFELSVAQHGEQLASRLMRKFGIRFSRHHPQGDEVKQAFIAVMGLPHWRAVLDKYYAEDGPGVGGDDALPEETTPAGCEAAMDCPV
jgi:tRNA-dihydrouridine synthase